ncbi:Pyruvate/2-oxoglutarate dehydrogenase complex, dihydrolipoamide dehydrogenase component [Hyella patelloides LEGE 07179]|uniref:Pyruvate/2-oxoglutarate dehydrogenase complex, dihydrolipoamide dehydrogenase component n=1 Tax=Hyella patelloides LEGE 07179 TaxID=945734 RepID=A0A563VIV1_9CYAN|nr:mercuric reductase [Hyella patelloides]VEP11323.1 Pyruvate/2-oxoglutarate dehydrogenase complex, dihydrolipoamide dehydrogenase component [Hyella patelloides LEGE 07179]
MNIQKHATTITPLDKYNQELLNNVHPSDWINPTPAELYDLVVIGAGTAGLVTAKGAGGLGLGLKVALIEKHLMGGDCLNVGCVPSKCLIRSSRAVADMRDAGSLGVIPPEEIKIHFPTVMARMRQVRTKISPVDSAMSAKKVGVDVFFGEASFTSNDTLTVKGQTLRFKKAVIATGARAVKPQIQGLESAGYLTNETVFSLTELPPRLAVIGGGPIGCELAQSFQRLGSQVTLFHRGNHILNKEDNEAAEIVQQALIKDGIRLILACQMSGVEKTAEGKIIHFSCNGKSESIVVDEILAGAGRQPNVESLNLEAVGVEYDPRKGVIVNDNLQTSNPKIYAAGDICMNWKFTHAADAAARIVLKNTLFSPFGFGKYKLSDLVMPWVTYTHPEIAHVGMYEEEAQAKGIDCNTIKIDFDDVDRALADGETEGFLKIFHKKGSDEILGATIVASHAGEMISEVTTAIVHKIGLSKMSSVIHPYPTQAEAIKKAADTYRRTLLTENTKKLLGILTKFS